MNTLEFSLALSTGAFMSGISKASSGARSMISSFSALTGVTGAIGAAVASARGMANVVEGVDNAIARGAALQRISETTGESVAALARIQAGLKAVDIEAGAVGPMILRMQRALGGVSEEGEPTAGIFAQIGLSIADLKAMGAPDAITKIAGAINRLDNASAAFAASKIFGRGARRKRVPIRNGVEFSLRGPAWLVRSAV